MSKSPDPRTPLLQAAERFERVVRIVKEKQRAETGAAPLAPVADPFLLHPEETWARNYATHAVRPQRPAAGEPPLFRFAAPAAGFAESPAAPEAQKAPETRSNGHIGGALGKPGPRRSWVARLFGAR